MAVTAKKKPATKKVKQAKTTKKTVAKKALVKTKVSSASTNKNVVLDRIRKFNIFAAISSAAFAVLSVVFMTRETVVANLPYAAKDEFASTDATVFGAAYKTLCELEVRYLLAFIFGLSAIFSLLLATKLRSRYNAQLAKSVSFLRWIFTAISFGLILALTAKLTQVDNAVTLKTISALVLATVILWIISEQQNRGTKGKMAHFYLSLLTLFLAIAPVAVSLIASGMYGMEWFGWHVYLLVLAVVAGLGFMAYSQYKIAKSGISAKEYLELEGRNLSVEYLVKFSVFIILLGAFLK